MSQFLLTIPILIAGVAPAAARDDMKGKAEEPVPADVARKLADRVRKADTEIENLQRERAELQDQVAQLQVKVGRRAVPRVTATDPRVVFINYLLASRAIVDAKREALPETLAKQQTAFETKAKETLIALREQMARTKEKDWLKGISAVDGSGKVAGQLTFKQATEDINQAWPVFLGELGRWARNEK